MFGGDRLNQETGYNSRGCPFLKSFVRTSTGFEPVTLAILVRCSNQLELVNCVFKR